MAAAVRNLSGRLALVTGGASGIGKAVCQALAAEGANVVVTDRYDKGAQESAEALPNTEGTRHIHRQLDVVCRVNVAQVLEEVCREYQTAPCILVNSAGIALDDFLLKVTEEKFDQVIQVNLKGTFLVTQAVAKLMVEQGVKHGSIVNLSSIVGKVGNLGQASYAASKAGVLGMTKSCAKELARYGIRCNAVLPGFIDTPMTQAVPKKVLEKVVGTVPLGRQGMPSEIADAVSFLASNRSSYITGASIEVTGGLLM